jgi:hypothetical protein
MAQSQFYMKYLNKILKHIADKPNDFIQRSDIMDSILFDKGNEEENETFDKLIKKLVGDKYILAKDEKYNTVKITESGLKFINESKGYTLRDKIAL